jgi:hypothetical protein
MMTGLFVVRKRVTESSSATESAAGRALQQLAALDRARDSLQQACQWLATAAGSANKLYTKIQQGAESFRMPKAEAMGLAPLLIGKAKTLEFLRGFCFRDIRVVMLWS